MSQGTIENDKGVNMYQSMIIIILFTIYMVLFVALIAMSTIGGEDFLYSTKCEILFGSTIILALAMGLVWAYPYLYQVFTFV